MIMKSAEETQGWAEEASVETARVVTAVGMQIRMCIMMNHASNCASLGGWCVLMHECALHTVCANRLVYLLC